MGCKNQDAKTQGHCYSKREEALHPSFGNPYFEPFLKIPDPEKISGRPDELKTDPK